MSRIVLLILLFVASADRAAPNQVEYPPLARDTLVGAWQGLIGIGTHPVVFHAVIAPRDSDSYKNFAWIKGRISIPDRPKPGPASFYFERITWLRDVGWAALRAAEKIRKK